MATGRGGGWGLSVLEISTDAMPVRQDSDTEVLLNPGACSEPHVTFHAIGRLRHGSGGGGLTVYRVTYSH